MQQRMKTHHLSDNQVAELLLRGQTGSLATLNANGYPYVTPVHFLFRDNVIYMHGLPQGRKIDNIRASAKVSLAVYEMDGLLLDPAGQPCDTNTKYRSVIVLGDAVLLEDKEQKKQILQGLVEKYTPELAGRAFPENMLNGTAVIKINILDITGKFYE